MKKLFLAALMLAATAAGAQYNESAGDNAPMAVEDRVVFDKKTGKTRKVRVKVAPQTDPHGNAQGNQYDLAVDGAFDGQTVAVLHFYTQENFNFEKPKAALKQKGFGVYRWVNAAPPVEEFEKKLEKACQLWIISSSDRRLSDAHVAVIKRFFESGKGVYIWGDNQPYYADANVVGKALIGATMEGNLTGNQVVGVRDKGGTKAGVLKGHLVTTGIQNLYEGVTIATLDEHHFLEPLVYGSAGNLVAASYNKDGKRLIFDGGFTRLYINWDTAGTARYVKNAAAWLTNAERFGDAVVANKGDKQARK
jgi:hypothetical protein